MTEKINRVYLFVASKVDISDATAKQMQLYGLKLLMEDPTFKKIMDQAAKDQVPMVSGQGIFSTPAGANMIFEFWLKQQGAMLRDARTVLGKKIFLQGGSAQNPADGRKFDWILMGCFM